MTVIGNILGLGLARGIAQVMAHFRAQGTFNDGFLELMGGRLDRLGSHRASDKLIQQCRRDIRQRHVHRRLVSLDWHICSF
jgi:hypothetical protein